MEKPPVLTLETAPEATKPLFESIVKRIGRLPNLYSVLGHSAPALEANLTVGRILEKGHFDARHGEIIKLAASQANACHYCISAHTAILKSMGFSEEETLKIRKGGLSNPKLEALAALTREIVTTRGFPSAVALEGFYAQGYSHGALMELVAYIALNTLNNYINHIAETPIDWPTPAELPVPTPQ